MRRGQDGDTWKAQGWERDQPRRAARDGAVAGVGEQQKEQGEVYLDEEITLGLFAVAISGRRDG